jgi:hypothetical protein
LAGISWYSTNSIKVSKKNTRSIYTNLVAIYLAMGDLLPGIKCKKGFEMSTNASGGFVPPDAARSGLI